MDRRKVGVKLSFHLWLTLKETNLISRDRYSLEEKVVRTSIIGRPK